MRTLLDDAKTWFLYGIVYQDELRIIVSEGFVGEKTEDVTIGEHTIRDSRPVGVSESSRQFSIRFPHIIAWQVVDESYTAFDEYEKWDDKGTLQILTRSKYFDYVKENHGWFEDIVGPAKHYRVWTENEVIEVVACEIPIIEPWEDIQTPVAYKRR